MNINFSRYQLTPKKKLNRLSSLEPKEGVYLSARIKDQQVFADYFPHVPLGDMPVEEFLETFRDQKTEYQRKMLALLESDLQYQSFPARSFRNHQLWSGTESFGASVIKYKLLHPQDRVFHEALKQGIRVRLDANGMYDSGTMHELIDPLPREWVGLIDYVEDPLRGTDWSAFPLKRARDFIPGRPYDFTIYKPNCEFRPADPELVYSAYLGSELGTWHAYCELIEHGDLNRIHGIRGTGFYEEVRDFFVGSFESGFSPDLTLIRELYQELSMRPWSALWTM